MNYLQIPRQQSEAANLKRWMTQPEAIVLRDFALAKATAYRIDAANHLGAVVNDSSRHDEAVKATQLANRYLEFVNVFNELTTEAPFTLTISPETSSVIVSAEEKPTQ